MAYAKDLTGKRFGRLSVLSRNTEKQIETYLSKGYSKAFWNCQCDCGNYCVISSSSLNNQTNPTLSCGCLRKEVIHRQKNTKQNNWIFDQESRTIKGVDCNGIEFLLDLEDYNKVKDYCWHVNKRGYVVANSRNGSNRVVWMHRIITNASDRDIVDHINWNRQDNRKSNLRIATKSQNNINIKKRSNNTSGYTGVSRIKRTGKYRSSISIGGNKYYLGDYDTLEEAVNARHIAELQYHGEWSGEINRKDFDNYS